MRTLVIDDSRATRAILRKMLTELGSEVLEAGDGQEALRLLEATADVDLALVDWNMPVMNGLEFVRAVRADARFDRTRLMMVTTETEMTQVAAALEAGANEYVMKPFTRDIIVEKLAVIGLGQAV